MSDRGKQFFELYKKGQTTTKIAKLFNISKQRVCKVLKRDFPEYLSYRNWQVNKIVKKCPICNKDFDCLAANKRKWCSRKCFGISETKRGFNIKDIRKYERIKRKKYYRENSDIVKRIVKKSALKYKEKVLARVKVNEAIRTGKLVKPNECSVCYQQEMRIVGHHPDYSKPLEVIWLCDVCHKAIHKI